MWTRSGIDCPGTDSGVSILRYIQDLTGCNPEKLNFIRPILTGFGV